ncbi:hypothetical protein MYCO108962_17695 [Mycobacterium colombiense]
MSLVSNIAVPSVSVIATATVAVWSKRIDARSKREDRQHEIALEVERRFGQDKVNALKTLIAATQYVKWRAQLTGAPNTDESHRRAVTIRALHEFRAKLGNEDGIAELLAYAADPVREAVDRLLAEVNEQRRRHLMSLMILQNIAKQLSQLYEQLPEPRNETAAAPSTSSALDTFHRWQVLSTSETQTLDKIGNDSNLDVDEVIALCDKVIDAARNDLRGRYGN